MSRPSQLAAATLAGAVVVAALVATALGWWNTEPSLRAPAHPLVVRTRLEPDTAFFGDPVVVEVAVDLDPRVVLPSSVRVEASFSPYLESTPPLIGHAGGGREETVSYSYTIQCVSDGCLPVGARRIVRLPAVVVTARAGGRELRVTAALPAATIVSRLAAADLRSATPPFVTASSLPPPSYGLPPTPTALALTAAAALLGAAAVFLVAVELTRLATRRRDALEEPTPLISALAFVRDAARRPDAADRRKALELLAETLVGEGSPTLADPTLVDTAEQAAWAESPPSPERALEVADRVEAASEAERS